MLAILMVTAMLARGLQIFWKEKNIPLGNRNDVRIEYDERKNLINIRKHGISLDDGLAAINDPDSIISFDTYHSTNEPRYVAIGRSGNQVLFVVFTMRDEEERIISVRKAEREEEKWYWKAL